MLKLEEDFKLHFNGDDEFFLYIGNKDRDSGKLNNQNINWTVLKYDDWEMQV